ncbi:protein ABHD16A-like [Limulus polyphemus]|uniref:Protein ABHD16A-like n=1 Tax=Limulus polyphemus TaxID=6850 RepID=A0ABM1S4E8_LIMPO|nr:protein ABHD16A-like [Limulus polyphemus]
MNSFYSSLKVMGLFCFVRCIIGPRLFRINAVDGKEGRIYDPNILEAWSDYIIKSLTLAWGLGVYSSPAIAAILYRKGYFTVDGISSLGRLVSLVGVTLLGTIFFRGLGRYMNYDYVTFLNVLESEKSNINKVIKTGLRRYDFEFHDWPVSFRWNDVEGDKSKPPIFVEKPSSRSSIFMTLGAIPCEILSYIAIHTFGRRLIYPGTVKLLQAAVVNRIFHLCFQYGAERFKLITRDGNAIDSVFVDRRSKKEFPNGETLVICCEGNAGFYEYGAMATPLEAGYSVLGWNHPGFGGSTGVPFPSQETNAIDVVIQFAIHRFGFMPENIMIYAWSIGGFPASWAAMNYPDIKGLILDATFDDILPLAKARMPPSWGPLVGRTIRNYMNLNNAEQVIRYPGPFLLIRRVRDEMICTSDSSPLQTNRGNDLLSKVLQYRYPKLITPETRWALEASLTLDKDSLITLWHQYEVDEDICAATVRSYIEEKSASFPMSIGDDMTMEQKLQLMFYLVQKHMVDFDSTHCTPLPVELFQQPWDPEALLNQTESSDDQEKIKE